MRSKLGLIAMKAAEEVGNGIEITGIETSSISEVSSSLLDLFKTSRGLIAIICLLVCGVQVVKFICSSGQEKMQHFKIFGFSLLGFVIFLLLPSIINFIISFF